MLSILFSVMLDDFGKMMERADSMARMMTSVERVLMKRGILRLPPDNASNPEVQ
jgi:hypothetical protein